jgi:hypothetical protein
MPVLAANRFLIKLADSSPLERTRDVLPGTINALYPGRRCRT